MKQIFLKALKIFLITAAVLLLVALVFGVVLSLDWPWWVGFFVLLGLLGLVIGLVLIRKIWLKRREQDFVQEIVEQDNAKIRAMGAKDKERAQELQNRWKEAIETLRHSHLRKQGNPLYVLPWYVIVGESGSGKTTAIKSARLSSPFAEVSRISGISGTKNCDWWFFEQAILIDTAGRYAIPVDEGRDKEEWQAFLGLLAKYRKKEPLNGLVVTVAANKLVEAEKETLEEDGKNIRRRIDELMRVLGAKFPVYILVTKCDLIQGMAQFCDSLPEKSLDQAMGLINRDFSKDVDALQTRGMGVITDRLRDLRLLLLHKKGYREGQGAEPGLLLFPEEFSKLKSGLSAFVEGAFQENPYQETPLLRGLFFSSGRQEGSPYSHFLSALGLIQERDILPGTNKGLFLHDFFGRILPTDRRMFAPTQRSVEWTRLTRNLGLTAWVAVVVAICGLLSFSFVKNLRTLRVVSSEFSKPPVLQGDVVSNVVTMDRFRQAIFKVEDQNRNWWIPRFGLNESNDVEVRLKQKYCDQLKGSFLVPLDKEMATSMAYFSNQTPDHIIGEHVAHLVRRINLLRARLQGDSTGLLYVMPQPSYAPILSKTDQTLIPEIEERFGDLYLSYLEWQSDEAGLNQEMNELQSWLKTILTLEGSSLRWLVRWIHDDRSLSQVTLVQFWGGDLAASEEPSVAAGFTVSGKEKIDAFLKEIETALADPLVIASRKLEFQSWYRKAYFDAWHAFGAGFPLGKERLQRPEERQQIAARMAMGEGPYFSLLEKMAEELEPMVENEALPTWVELVFEFNAVRIKAAQEAALKEKGALAKVTSKGQNLIGRLEKKLAKLDKEKRLEAELLASRAFAEYEGALSEIAPVATSRAVAFDMAAQVFKEDPATSRSPVIVAQNGLNKLKTFMAGGQSGQDMFWSLVSGPLHYLWFFVRMETACHLQDLWEKEVLVELQGLPEGQLTTNLVLGDEGFASKFVKGPAEPFLNRSLQKGYHGKKVLEGSIPFESAFFSFLTKGARSVKPVQSNYSVDVRGLPTDTNKGAGLRVHATRLELHCAKEATTLVNLNYPVSKTFDWSPMDCGDVVFEMEVGNMVLTKKYTGERGFPEFLKDFKNGEKTFYASDFPEKESDLRRVGIKTITAKYRFKGHQPVLKLLGESPGRVPREIATCWDR